jgi:diguanylate cyclase (GGDEF)-like protein/PAS domain S-box-containing protein
VIFRRPLQAWHTYLAVGVLATGAYFLLPTQSAQYLLRFLVVGSTSAAFVAGIVIHRPKRPLPWYVLGFAFLMPVLGSLTYVYYLAVLGVEPPRASVADAFFIATYLCVAAALLVFQSRRLARDQASTIDPIIVAVGVGMLAWVFLMKPYATDQSLPVLERLVLTTYPLMDVVLLAVVVRMLLVRGERPFSYYAMVTGLVSLLTFDAAYAATTQIGTYQNGNPIDALEILSFVFAGVAVLHPSMVDLSDKTVLEPETRLTRRRLALLAAASLMAPLLIALQWTRGGTIDVPVLVGGSVVLFLLVLGRMAGIMSTREEAIGREKLLRRTAAALVAAPNREGIYEVALDATRDLLGTDSSSWVGIATGSPEEATIVAASGEDSGEVVGAQIHLDEYADALREGLLEGRVVEAEGLNIADSSRLKILGFNPDAQQFVYLIPLLVQAQLRGAILTLTDFLLSEDSQATLEALGREVALALESTALSEEVHRRESEERFRALVQNSSDVVAIVRADGVTSYISPVVERILGYKPEHGVGRNVFQPPMMHPDDADRVRQTFARLVGSPGAEATSDFRLRHSDGRWVQVEATSKNLLYDPNIGGIVVNYRDITERKNFEERLKHQAFHDPLTELPNRALFMNRLGHALIRAERSEKAAAVLFLDLDNFKRINDSLGHEAGDGLLVSVAKRLRGCVRAEDTAARFGGDEFTVLLENIPNSSHAVRVADHITRALSDPFVVESREVIVTTSIGISLGTSGRERPTDVLRNADMALYRAKASGKATYEVFDPLMNIAALERLDLEADLRRATDRGQFVVHYQPQLELATGKIAGWEALVRWMHPERGLIFPATFLPVAEETGLVVQIGNLVLEEACRQAKVWQDKDSTDYPLMISVNVSARQLQRPDDLLSELIRILGETELAPGSLVLEITESMLMDDAEHNVDVLSRLQDLGVSIAIDDFGTGYSNLAYLKRFPVDMLKVDKSFVDGLGENQEATAIVEAVVSLARAMGMQTIAEGIETTGQAELLRALGCELGQGYYFSKPLPAHEAHALLPISPDSRG